MMTLIWNLTTVPLPSADSISMLPPNKLHNLLHIDNPMPVPVDDCYILLSHSLKALNISLIFSFFIPTPVSLIVVSILFSWIERHTFTLPSKVYLMEFENVLKNINWYFYTSAKMNLGMFSALRSYVTGLLFQ